MEFHRHEILPGWLEDYPNFFMRFIALPPGFDFPINFDSITDPINGPIKYIKYSKLKKILESYHSQNLFRSWQLFDDEFKPIGRIPLIIDIDNSDLDLSKAYELTKKCLCFFEQSSLFQNSNSVRIVFSGKKGFHIEARCEQITDGDQIRCNLLSYLNEKRDSNFCQNEFYEGTIDVFHDIIRVTGSNNIWKSDLETFQRNVVQYSVDKFNKLSLSKLLESDFNKK